MSFSISTAFSSKIPTTMGTIERLTMGKPLPRVSVAASLSSKYLSEKRLYNVFQQRADRREQAHFRRRGIQSTFASAQASAPPRPAKPELRWLRGPARVDWRRPSRPMTKLEAMLEVSKKTNARTEQALDALFKMSGQTNAALAAVMACKDVPALEKAMPGLLLVLAGALPEFDHLNEVTQDNTIGVKKPSGLDVGWDWQSFKHVQNVLYNEADAGKLPRQCLLFLYGIETFARKAGIPLDRMRQQDLEDEMVGHLGELSIEHDDVRMVGNSFPPAADGDVEMVDAPSSSPPSGPSAPTFNSNVANSQATATPTPAAGNLPVTMMTTRNVPGTFIRTRAVAAPTSTTPTGPSTPAVNSTGATPQATGTPTPAAGFLRTVLTSIRNPPGTFVKR